jgi:hypothetical protein
MTDTIPHALATVVIALGRNKRKPRKFEQKATRITKGLDG